MKIEDAALSGAFQVLFDRLVPKVEALKYILALIRGPAVENDVERFKNTWMTVKAVLNDAEEKQYKIEAVKLWLDKLKDAAYDAEDVLDEFATEALREKLEAKSETISNQVWRHLAPAFLKFSVRSFNGEIESKIKAISKRFDDLASKRFELGLEEIGAWSCSSRVRETSSVVDESRVYGRDDDREKIIKLLLKDDSNCDDKITVIPIVGMGGVGKTTLAQIVYNDKRVKSHFNMKTWVCVSEEFDVKRITKSILKSVVSQLPEEKQKLATSEVFDSDELNLVQVEVKKAVNGEKVLIVLDDLWSVNYDDWDVLQNPFRVGALGTKIIVTTRIIHVASRMGTVGNHYLGLLSKDHCWSVFAQHAFWSGNIDAKPNLAAIGKKIVEKCKGLPLAAKMLGGLLRSNLEEDEWEDILNSKIWELPEKETGILPALRLSYHHLPADLKHCFAYCSILPQDYEFQEEELVLLWIAEGLVLQASRGKQMEDLAVEYFRELVSRSFFQPSSNNKSSFVMHDLVNDLARWVAGETCFRLEDKFEGRKQCKISKKARHSSYVGSNFDGVKKFEAFDEVECLRTFLPLKTPYDSNLTRNIPLILLPKLRWLRVLSLAGYHITELPESISDLKHLRYLDLSRTQIICLPESTSTLYNLQMLILKDCYCLKKLPIAMGNLINLRLLDIADNKGESKVEEMPLRVGKLTSLRKLSNFIVGSNSESGIGELANLKCLRGTLCISSLENVTKARDARQANLKDKQDLDVLTVEWSSEFSCPRNKDVEEVLDMLQPHNKLKELNIKRYGGTRFPMWIGDPLFSNMVLLRLERCVNCSTLPTLGQLSSLKDLCIEGMDKVKFVGHEFYGEGCPKPFPSLETLSFTNMKELEEWSHIGIDGEDKAFLCLRELSIETCPKLSGNLPDCLPSLEKLLIRQCQQLSVSIPSMPKLCELSIQECLEVVNESTVCLSSLKSMDLLSISNRMRLTEEFIRGLTKVEKLQIATCNELMSLWQNMEGLQLLPSLRHLIIRQCPEFVSLVGEEEERLQPPCILKYLELESCDNLEKLQGLHNLSSLKKLKIKGCSRLVSFPDTGLPSMLRELRIEGCNDLKSVPQEMMGFSNYVFLEYLYIEGCNSITSITKGQLPSIMKKLEIRKCLNLKSLVEEEGVLISTSTTSLHNSCTSLLEELYIDSCPVLKYLSSRGNLPATLKSLKVESCSQLESIAVRLDNNASLESIYISDCENLKSLPEGLYNLFHLSSISIYKCPSLVFSLPDGRLPSNSLEDIQFSYCESLQSLPMGLENLSHLSVISICECPSLVSFPVGGLPATNLRELYISSCKKLVALPHHMHNLTSLQKLAIKECQDIVSFPEEGFPPNLTVLDITDLNICKSLFDWGLHKLTSLRKLVINGGCSFLVSFPEEENGMILPTSLIELTIQNFPNLKYLSTKGFQNLTSLEDLGIEDCLNLKSFPEEGLPPSLLKLKILKCPLLREEWPKISHIPRVSQ